ncbi:hypothetical protein LOZ61_001308 [Ophidiomyces ophidiicola]|nr:hypothetical protein LOZ61_001308 [Ophidiomyces ophidiicola]KAI1923041.1 hypothetical protein LOZ64_001128 [Ophidiomyces ophidiicola]KAI1930603.1 hypothetical protein LOZ60_000834 [Ophidiomyces ophidiicola]KAI2010446.1 hypothetical protein LOZ49_003469 [Ophidiomyces ophidiicola]KAI2025765.1 hypothetical protein LOZ46_000699 [Ophidiomyces ophidiicola]
MPGPSRKRVCASRLQTHPGSPPKKSRLDLASTSQTAGQATDKNTSEDESTTPSHEPAVSSSSSSITSSAPSEASDSDDDDDDDDPPDIVSLNHSPPQSSSGEDEDSEVEGNIITITQPKPQIRRIPASELSSRLSAFLPVLKAANEDLERDIVAGKLIRAEIHDEGESVNEETGGKQPESQYIEMNLGLGVLEQNQDQVSETSSDEASTPIENEGGQARPEKDTNVLDKLMGSKSKVKKPVIHEMD